MWRSSKTALCYVLIALFCALFAWVYEHFSHGVWSFSMVFAFVYPLLLGALPALLLGVSPAGAGLWRAGIAALTVGSLLRGALEIYGTGHHLTWVYGALGAGLCAAGELHFIFDVLRVSRYNKAKGNLHAKEENIHAYPDDQP